jgi:type IV pilus biogenesis protein CpaD/CtpE
MRAIVFAASAALCVGCAGRDPQPVATVQPTDAMATCAMITAEIEANNIKVPRTCWRRGR